ncbi:hypothetical protein CCP3SC15_4490002 [Gammaproteobacteria bacterium]
MADGLPRYVSTDDGKLRQILINLLGNAVKFTEQGAVVLRARASSEMNTWRLAMEVEDTGPGLSASELARLFQSFAQTRIGIQKGGTGLGLALSRQYARAMGGDIVVSSQSGTGSVFQLTLPVEIGDSSAMVAITHRRVIGLRSGQETQRILIVGDRTDHRLFLRRLLESVGFAVREEIDGTAALNTCSDWRPHLIIINFSLLVMNGHEVTRLIRTQSSGQDCRIVVLVEEGQDAVTMSDVDGYLRNPITDEELLVVIGEQLGLSYEYSVDEPVVLQPSVPDLPNAAMMARIPPEVRAEMREAIARVHELEMRRLIERLPADQITVANALRHSHDCFDWDALEALLKHPVDQEQ